MDPQERLRMLQLAGAHYDLTQQLDVEQDTLDEWQRSGRGLTRQQVRLLAYIAEVEERSIALEESGLPTCKWLDDFKDQVTRANEDLEVAAQEVQAHAKECPTCQRRQLFEDERFGPLKTPGGPLVGLMLSVTASIMRLPKVLRPAAVGALLLCAIVVVRALFQLLFLLGSPEWKDMASQLPLALIGAAGAGASGGLVYSVTRPAAQLLGPASEYVSGIAAVAGYLAGLVLLGPYAFGREVLSLDTASGVWILVGMSIVFGLAVGHGFRTAK